MDAASYLRNLDFVVSDVRLDGEVHRVPRGSKSARDAWYVGFADPAPILIAGDWREPGVRWHWRANGVVSLDDKIALQKRINDARVAASERLEAKRENARIAAQMQLGSANTNPPELPNYLKAKGLDRMFGAFESEGNLLIPMRDGAGELWGIQTIYPNGRKMFMSGQRAKGCFHLIEPGRTAVILICEGFATAASLHVASGLSVACGFSAQNLGPTTNAVRAMAPECQLIICADNDHKTPGNPGLKEATAVATRFGAGLAVPFGAGTDFNDMAKEFGIGAVADLISQKMSEV